MGVMDFIMGTDPEFQMTPQTELGKLLLEQFASVYGQEGVWSLLKQAKLYDDRMNSLYDQAGDIQPTIVKIGNTVIPMKGPGRKDIALQAGLADQQAKRSIDPALNMGVQLEGMRRGYTTPAGTGLMDVIGPALAQWAGNGFKNPFKSSPTSTATGTGAGAVGGGAGASGAGAYLGGESGMGMYEGMNASELTALGEEAAQMGLEGAGVVGSGVTTAAALPSGTSVTLGGMYGGMTAQELTALGEGAAEMAAGGSTAAGAAETGAMSSFGGMGAIGGIGALIAAMGVASHFLAQATDSSHTPQTAREYINGELDYIQRVMSKGGPDKVGRIWGQWDQNPLDRSLYTIRRLADRAGYSQDQIAEMVKGAGYDMPANDYWTKERIAQAENPWKTNDPAWGWG